MWIAAVTIRPLCNVLAFQNVSMSRLAWIFWIVFNRFTCNWSYLAIPTPWLVPVFIFSPNTAVSAVWITEFELDLWPIRLALGRGALWFRAHNSTCVLVGPVLWSNKMVKLLALKCLLCVTRQIMCCFDSADLLRPKTGEFKMEEEVVAVVALSSFLRPSSARVLKCFTKEVWLSHRHETGAEMHLLTKVGKCFVSISANSLAIVTNAVFQILYFWTYYF